MKALAEGIVKKTMKLHRLPLLAVLPFAIFFVGSECRGKTGSAAIVVTNAAGAPIVGAEVKAAGRTGRTGSGGVLFFETVPEGDYVVEVKAPGFAPGFHRILVQRDSASTRTFRLLPVITQNLRDLSASISVEVAGLDLVIPGGAIGERGPGLLRAAYVDPTGPDLRSMPGEFDGKDQNGRQVALESLGAFSMEIQDQTGKQIELRKPFIVRLPYNGKGKPYEEVPLWSYDPALGSWRQEGTGKILKSGKNLVLEAKIPHLSWWNLDRPMETKTSIWVKSFSAPNDKTLVTPTLSATGMDYTGISFPYSYYEKFFNEKGPNLPGACIDVKTGSKVRLHAGYYGSAGVFETSREIQIPNTNSSCRSNPEAGIVIEKMQLGGVPASCIRGRLKFKGAPSDEMGIEVFQAQSTKESAESLAYWDRPIAAGVSGADGSFCLDHLPAGRSVTISVSVKPKKTSWFSVSSELYAQSTQPTQFCAPPRILVQVPVSDGFRCGSHPDKCTDVGDLRGEWKSCGGQVGFVD